MRGIGTAAPPWACCAGVLRSRRRAGPVCVTRRRSAQCFQGNPDNGWRGRLGKTASSSMSSGPLQRSQRGIAVVVHITAAGTSAARPCRTPKRLRGLRRDRGEQNYRLASWAGSPSGLHRRAGRRVGQTTADGSARRARWAHDNVARRRRPVEITLMGSLRRRLRRAGAMVCRSRRGCSPRRAPVRSMGGVRHQPAALRLQHTARSSPAASAASGAPDVRVPARAAAEVCRKPPCLRQLGHGPAIGGTACRRRRSTRSPPPADPRRSCSAAIPRSGLERLRRWHYQDQYPTGFSHMQWRSSPTDMIGSARLGGRRMFRSPDYDDEWLTAGRSTRHGGHLPHARDGAGAPRSHLALLYTPRW